jgi:SAM-dependent methyltransferase
MNESQIQAFWNAHPCGDEQVGGVASDLEEFFRRYDAFRYREERHIPRCLDAVPFAGRRTLEIGLGQGADAEQIIRRGAVWSGVDLTPESVARVKARLRLRGLPYERLEQASVLDLPFGDGTFDVVFSHGVLHHVPQIHRAQAEIARVLKPGGLLVMMVYARWSLNYLVAISIVRRLALAALYASGARPGGIVGEHLENARRVGLWSYLRMDNFLHRNTDGPGNPYSKVYDLDAVTTDFPAFDIVSSHREFMHAPPLPVRALPLARLLGWHLWVHLRPRDPGSLAR